MEEDYESRDEDDYEDVGEEQEVVRPYLPIPCVIFNFDS